MPAVDRTQTALLKAVAADPHNDLPRLVYADYLEEHGQPDRAEIIRVQCELARLQDEDCDGKYLFDELRYSADSDYSPHFKNVDWSLVDADLYHRITLTRRNAELYSANVEAWKAAECPKVSGLTLGLDRGFWTSASVTDVAELLKSLGKAKLPVPVSRFHSDRDWSPVQVATLLDSGLLDRAESVGGDMQRPTLYQGLAKRLATTSVREVGVSGYTETYVKSLAQSAHWGSLRRLGITIHGDARLSSFWDIAGSKHLRDMRSLSLYLDAGLYNLGGTLSILDWPQLRRLECNAWLDSKDATWIAKSHRLGGLRSLVLGNRVGGAGVKALLQSDKLPRLVQLGIQGDVSRGVKLDPKGTSGPQGIRHLKLEKLNDADFAAIGRCRFAPSLQVFEASSKAITDAGIKQFCATTKTVELTVLELMWGQIGPAGAAAIAKCKALAKLQGLQLWGNPIGFKGAKALAESKTLASLRHLHIQETDVTPAGMDLLRKRFGEDAVG